MACSLGGIQAKEVHPDNHILVVHVHVEDESHEVKQVA